MDTAGLLRGKENMELHAEVETVRMSEHGMKVRQAREARRKRILASSSERLAFITGEANAIPTSPLLNMNDHSKACNALISLSCLLNQDSPHHQCSSGKEPIIKKNVLFNDHSQTAESHKSPVDSRAYISQEDLAVVQPMKSEEAMEASKQQAEHDYARESPVTFKTMFNTCINQSLFPRLVSAACIAVAFLVNGITQGSRLDLPVSFPAMSGYDQTGRLNRSDVLSTTCYAIASVMIVDLLLFVGAFFLVCGGREQLKVLRSNGQVVVEKATLWIGLHLLFSICVDCSISASLLFGGFNLLFDVA